MLKFVLNKYPGSIIQSRRISQDMLEGLFGTICELGGDSSTQTLKSYGHALNKYQVTTLVSSEIKSINYGKTDSTGSGITILIRRYVLIIINYYFMYFIYIATCFFFSCLVLKKILGYLFV